MIIVVVVAADLVIQELMLKYLIKKGFTYKSWWWESWRRKKKKFEKRGEEVYNSLHWQISWSELLRELICWQVIKFFFYLWTLSVQSGQTCVNRQWQLYNNLFRHLKHNLEEKKRNDVMSWTYTKVLWCSCLLRL